MVICLELGKFNHKQVYPYMFRIQELANSRRPKTKKAETPSQVVEKSISSRSDIFKDGLKYALGFVAGCLATSGFAQLDGSKLSSSFTDLTQPKLEYMSAGIPNTPQTPPIIAKSIDEVLNGPTIKPAVQIIKLLDAQKPLEGMHIVKTRDQKNLNLQLFEGDIRLMLQIREELGLRVANDTKKTKLPPLVLLNRGFTPPQIFEIKYLLDGLIKENRKIPGQYELDATYLHNYIKEYGKLANELRLQRKNSPASAFPPIKQP
jgi:hypothetical protein